MSQSVNSYLLSSKEKFVLELTESPVLLLKEWPSGRFYIPLPSPLAFLPSPFVTDFTDAVPLQSIAPRPMGSRVERIPIDCLSPPLSREVPSSQK